MIPPPAIDGHIPIYFYRCLEHILKYRVISNPCIEAWRSECWKGKVTIWPDGVVTHEYPHLSSLLYNLPFFPSLLWRSFPLWKMSHISFSIKAKSVFVSFSLLRPVCPPTCLSVCRPLATSLAVNTGTVIGICRSAHDLIQRGVFAACLEIDLASKPVISMCLPPRPDLPKSCGNHF